MRTTVYNASGASSRLAETPLSGRPGQPDRRRFLGDLRPVPGGHDGYADDARYVELHLRQRGRENQRVARRLDSGTRNASTGAPGARSSRDSRSRNQQLGRRCSTRPTSTTRRVDVFDGTWQNVTPAGAFVDPQLPSGYAPFGIQTIGERVFVTYAKQDADAADEVAGQSRGFVDAYDLDGQLARPRRSARSARRALGPRARSSDVRPLRAAISSSATSVTVRSTRTRRRAPGSSTAARCGTSTGRNWQSTGLWALEFGNAGVERLARHALLHRRPRRRVARAVRNDHNGLKTHLLDVACRGRHPRPRQGPTGPAARLRSRAGMETDARRLGSTASPRLRPRRSRR